MTKPTRNTLTAIAAVAITAAVLFAGFAVLASTANAQSRDLTGQEFIKDYEQANSQGQDVLRFYVSGVVDGLTVSGSICPPAAEEKRSHARKVMYHLGASDRLQAYQFDVAVASAAFLAFPCGDPA